MLIKMELKLKSSMTKRIETLMPEGAAATSLLLRIQRIITSVKL